MRSFLTAAALLTTAIAALPGAAACEAPPANGGAQVGDLGAWAYEYCYGHSDEYQWGDYRYAYEYENLQAGAAASTPLGYRYFGASVQTSSSEATAPGYESAWENTAVSVREYGGNGTYSEHTLGVSGGDSSGSHHESSWESSHRSIYYYSYGSDGSFRSLGAFFDDEHQSGNATSDRCALGAYGSNLPREFPKPLLAPDAALCALL